MYIEQVFHSRRRFVSRVYCTSVNVDVREQLKYNKIVNVDGRATDRVLISCLFVEQLFDACCPCSCVSISQTIHRSTRASNVRCNTSRARLSFDWLDLFPMNL
jgi:hypothetical protein